MLETVDARDSGEGSLSSKRFKQQAAWALGGALVASVVGCVIYGFKAEDWVTACYEGRFFPPLDALVAGHRAEASESHNLDYFLGLIPLAYSWIVVAAFAVAGAVVAALNPGATYRAARGALLARDSARNLAVVRITLFATALGKLYAFAPQLNGALIEPDAGSYPLGWSWLSAVLPLSPLGIKLLVGLTATCVLLAIIGWQTRFSVPAAAALTILVGAIIASLRVVNHASMTMYWLLIVLSFSRCGDAFSVDAWLRRRRGASPTGDLPDRAVAYGVPVRLAWMLIGVGYFFPGLWKLLLAGYSYVTGEYLTRILHITWAGWDGYEPFLRVDRSQTFMALLGIATILFEIGFVFVVWFPLCRGLLFIAGQGFHTGVRLFMGINFLPMQMCYVALIDWDRAYRWLRSEPATKDREVEAALPEAGRRLTGAVGPLIAGLLIAASAIVLGLLKLEKATYPVACFPTFSAPLGDEFSRPKLVVYSKPQQEGGSPTIDHDAIRSMPLAERVALKKLMRVGDPSVRQRRFTEMAESMIERGLIDKSIKGIELYEHRFKIDPDLPQPENAKQRLRASYPPDESKLRGGWQPAAS